MKFLSTFIYFEERREGWGLYVSFLVDNKLNRINLLVGRNEQRNSLGKGKGKGIFPENENS